MRVFFVAIISGFILISCKGVSHDIENVLSMAGKNRAELEKVINHYKELGDNEKLDAAYFLIGNMTNKYGRYGDIATKYFPVIDTLHALHDRKVDEDTIKRYIKNEWAKYEARFGAITPENYPGYADYNVANADFLIENIDYAFKAWREKPWAKHLNFDQFCESILPYRVYDEPLQFFRKRFFEEFAWLDDSVKTNDPVKACILMNSFLAKKFVFCSTLDKCPILGINDMYNLAGGICEHRYYLLTEIMRSVGIPIVIDFMPQQVDEAGSHSWMVLIDENGKSRPFNGGEPIAIPMDSTLNPISSKGYSTKVFRNTFAIQPVKLSEPNPMFQIPDIFKNDGIIDVSVDYEYPQSTIKFELKNKPSDDVKYVYLCAFRLSYNMVPIAYAEVDGNTAKFQNIGRNCVYVPVYVSNGKYVLANNPVYISKTDEQIPLSAEGSKFVEAKLTRKFFVQQYVFRMLDYARWMVGARLQGSNDKDFKDSVTLFTIDSSYYHFVEKVVKSNRSFRYYRYLSAPKEDIRIAEVDFVIPGLAPNADKSKMYTIFGNAITDSTKVNPELKNAFDGNVATNFNAAPGSWVAIDYGKPVKVDKVRFLVRNDLNVVEVGDTYELLYFEMGWKSLGKQVATNNYVIYKNVPENALLLLRDLTKGREERIFMYKGGRQVWL